MVRQVAEQRLAREKLPSEIGATFGDDEAIYLRGYYLAETQVAKRLLHLGAFLPFQTKLDPEKAITWLRQKLPFKLAP